MAEFDKTYWYYLTGNVDEIPDNDSSPTIPIPIIHRLSQKITDASNESIVHCIQNMVKG